MSTPGKVYLSDFADDLIGLLDVLTVDQAVIGGVSMGGQIAMETHRRYAGRIRALVLSDTSALPETPEGKTWRNRLADRLLAEGMAAYADDVIDKMLAAYNVTALPAVAAHVLGMMRATDPRGAAAALRAAPNAPTTVTRWRPRDAPCWSSSAPMTSTRRSRTPKPSAASPAFRTECHRRCRAPSGRRAARTLQPRPAGLPPGTGSRRG